MSKLQIIPTLNYELLNDAGEPVMTHEQIALCTQNTEESVVKLIDKYRSELEEHGAVGFQIRVLKAGKGSTKKHIYLLNEHQTTLLVMFMRNNEIVVKFKVAVVKAYFEAKSWIKDRESCKLEYKNLNKLLKDTRTEFNEETPDYIYSNEANMIDIMALGCKAKKYCEINDIPRESLRNNLSAAQLELIDKLQKYDEILLTSGELDYATRKEKLTTYKIRLVAKLLS